MSTNDAVFQRRNKQIEDAIDGQNLKQALQLIDKRIKKGEDTPFLKVSFWLVYIRYFAQLLFA
jgi:N-terminal acetyltransferase B complex non-catalytic subunit